MGDFWRIQGKFEDTKGVIKREFEDTKGFIKNSKSKRHTTFWPSEKGQTDKLVYRPQHRILNIEQNE